MKIKIDSFAGTRPRVSSRLLGNSDATIARNCRLYNGKLKAFREPETVEEGTILTSASISQVGIEVISYGLNLELSQVGLDVISRAQPALQVLQAGVEVVSTEP